MKQIVISGLALALPFLALAQNAEGKGLGGVLDSIGKLLDLAIGLLFALAVLAFFYGLAIYIFKSGKEKQEGINIMVMGTIALFVMASIYGIIGLLQNSFEVTGSEEIGLPDPTLGIGN
ncbi:MAG: hypothetical protein ACKKL4_00235 [Patescibacteria group bacterium]